MMQNYTSSQLDRGNARLIALVFAAVFATGAIRIFSGSSDMAPTVTAANIRRITLGMSRSDVQKILGPPRREIVSRAHDSNRASEQFTLQFANKVRYALWCPMIWVNFDNGRVVNVYAKRYEGWCIDYQVVYCLSEPIIDNLDGTFPP
jgi:hypothetical protein